MTPKKRALASIKATGEAPDAKPATIKSLEQRKHIIHQGGNRWSLTKRGEAYLAGRLGGNLGHRPTGAAGAKPTGRAGKARRGFNPTRAGQRAATQAEVESLRAAGWDVSAAPKILREHPAGKVERNPSKNPKTRAVEKARAWFGDDALVTEPKVLKGYTAPDCAVEIGEFVAIEYDSHKFDGKPRVYRHEFTKKRRLFVSPDGSTIIVWPPFKVTKRGIEG